MNHEATRARCLIVPGLHDSGTDHWQTWIEERMPGSARIAMNDWSLPRLEPWIASIRKSVDALPACERVFLVAHSFGCLAGYAAALQLRGRIAGALFVAPSDPLNVALPDSVFKHRLSFPSVVVASEDDAWMSLGRARDFARLWGSAFVNAGIAGHINVASGFGPWPEGLCLLQRLIDGAEPSVEAIRLPGSALVEKPCGEFAGAAS